MSTTNTQMQHLAEILTTHDAIDDVRQMVKERLFNRFLEATMEERQIISDILDAEKLFFSELEGVLEDIKGAEPVNDEKTED